MTQPFPVVHPGGRVTPASSAVQWGTPKAGQAKDSASSHAIGTIFKASNALARAAADAEIVPLKMVWFPSAAQAEAYAKRSYPLAYANWQFAQGHNLSQQLEQNLPGPLKGIAAVGDLAQRLTQGSTWVRVGEFVAGGLLLYMGLNAVLRGTPAGEVTQQARRAAKRVTSAAVPELRTARAVSRTRRVTRARERVRTREQARRRAQRAAERTVKKT